MASLNDTQVVIMHVGPIAGCNPTLLFLFGLFWLLFCGFLFVCLLLFLVRFVFDGIAHWTLYWSITSSFEAADLFDGLACQFTIQLFCCG